MTLGLTITAILCLVLGASAALSAKGALDAFTGRDPLGDAVQGAILTILSLFLIACLLGTVAAYRYLSGPTFGLAKSEWRCSKARLVKDDDGDYTVCDQYSRIRSNT